MCWIAKVAHDRELGGDYMITTLDMKFAKEFLEANGGVLPDNDTINSHASKYFKNTFEGYAQMNWPLTNIWKHWNSFSTRTVKVKIWTCPACHAQEEHQYSHVCPEAPPADPARLKEILNPMFEKFNK